MNKKGAELSLNVVVVAVLVIMVLVVVTIFFLGGMGGMTSKIKSMFFGTLAGTDRTIAVQTCQTRCEQAKLLPIPMTSAFCSSFYIDDDGNGEADKNDKGEYTKFYCYKRLPGDNERNLGVDCFYKTKEKDASGKEVEIEKRLECL